MGQDYKNWYICVNGKVDSAWQDDKAQAYEIYNWMLTEEGRKDSFLKEDDEITIHGVYMGGRELEENIRRSNYFFGGKFAE